MGSARIVWETQFFSYCCVLLCSRLEYVALTPPHVRTPAHTIHQFSCTGLLTGMIFLSRELESDMTRIFVRAGSIAVTIVLYTYSLYVYTGSSMEIFWDC